jgi:hypothetical protein
MYASIMGMTNSSDPALLPEGAAKEQNFVTPFIGQDMAFVAVATRTLLALRRGRVLLVISVTAFFAIVVTLCGLPWTAATEVLLARGDIIMLGAGIVGTSIALHLVKRGALFRRRGRGRDEGWLEGGILCDCKRIGPAHGIPGRDEREVVAIDW